ncbi:kinase-like domain-containing protein [Spinellus fusiger]|nr:kinase-like domain-containing protein [Spinellus fusiger]
MEEHPPEFVLSSAYKMSLLHTQSSRPHYITLAPHFLTQDYFEAHGPAEMGETDTCLETGHRSHYADQFTHMALLGSGHDATVSKVREVATGKVYAVKQTRQPFMSQQDRWLQLAEVECLYAVRESQHCVALLSAWEQEGYLFMQMELCASGSLKDYVNYQQGQVQEKVLWPILHALLKGLESIHKANIIHLDLKPSNILLHQSGQLKIADFGYSMKWGGEDTRETKGEGDRRYMAPDLLKGQFVMAADIYSLGLILLEMASRTVLPDTGDAWESLRVGDYSEYPMLYVSASLQQLIEWLLILHPKQRPTAHDVLAHPDMQEYTAHPPTHPFDGYIQALERLAVEEEERLSHQNIYHTPEMKAEYCWY